MTELLIEESPFGIRAALFEEGKPLRLLHRFKTGEPRYGDVVVGQAGARDSRLGAQVFDLGKGREGLLQIKDRAFPEGTTAILGVRRDAIGAKRPLLAERPSWRLPLATIPVGENGEPKPGPLGLTPPSGDLWNQEFGTDELGVLAGPPVAAQMIAQLASQDLMRIRTSSGAFAAALRPFLPTDFDITEDARVGADINDAEDEALARTVPLMGGGRLTVDQAEALTAIDVDIGNRAGKSAKGVAAGLFREALSELSRTISLRAIGGQVAIDLPRGSAKAPKMLRDQLTAALRGTGLSNIPAITKDGLVIAILRQTNRPVFSDLAEAEQGTFIRPRYTLTPYSVCARLFSLVRIRLSENTLIQYELLLPSSSFSLWDKCSASSVLTQMFGTRLTVSVSNTDDFLLEEAR